MAVTCRRIATGADVPAEAHPGVPGTVGPCEQRLGVGQGPSVLPRADQAVVGDVADRVLHALEQGRRRVDVQRIREEGEEGSSIALAHRAQGRRVDVVFAGLVGDVLDDRLPGRQTTVGDAEAVRESVHFADAVQRKDVIESLIEEPRAVVDAHHVHLRRQAEFEREPLEQALADAVHGPDERLRRALGQLNPTCGDQTIADPLTQLRSGLDGERGPHDALRGDVAVDKRPFEFPGQSIGLAAAGPGADERDMAPIGKARCWRTAATHWNASTPVSQRNGSNRSDGTRVSSPSSGG